MITNLGKHFVHSLLVRLDVFHLSLQRVLHFIFDQVDANSGLSVFETLIVYPERPLCFCYGVLQL